MALIAYWRQFVQAYGAHDAYWFFPKGRQVDTPEFGQIVSVFAEFDGKPWDPAAILARLKQKQLSHGDTAVPRMIKRAIESMGLCVIDEERGVFLTPLGRKFLEQNQDPEALEQHLWRYQFPNPLNPRARGIRLTPHTFLLEVLLSCDNYLSHDEFVLFVSRARRQSDKRQVVQRIKAWRRLNADKKAEIIDELPRLYRTVDGNSSYALGFHRCASYVLPVTLPGESKSGLRLDDTRLEWLRKKLKRHRGPIAQIEYDEGNDWVAALGSAEEGGTSENAVDYYLDVSEPAKAVAAFKRLPPEARRGVSVAEFAHTAFLEKHLEDFLETRLELIEDGLTPEWGGRQVRIGVGAIDLFARSDSGDLVVIELKKARASDKVFGQICRYIGWIRAHYAAVGQRVRGYIVATEMDEKLRYAACVAPAGVVRMKRFHHDDAAGIFVESD